MTTFEIDTELFFHSERSLAKEIIFRMGWNYDEKNGVLIINVPFDDEKLFNFIFDQFM